MRNVDIQSIKTLLKTEESAHQQGCKAEPLDHVRVNDTAVERLSGPRTAVRWDKYTLH